ncbi:MAG TPA: antibiotic biosynthesis monooxygenase [Stellaceae bacterium]|jgi:heme-degrading monooxygenase HmoA|nr:antibiotic biosynthesis monooxygenase [Stellaceae bacterium]
MYAVIFEVEPAPGHEKDYLDIAAELKPILEKIDGFISVERFRSLVNPTKILSLSFWRDEAAVRRWREQGDHRIAQGKGRGGIFADYRLSVASIDRQYGMFDRAQVPGKTAAAKA